MSFTERMERVGNHFYDSIRSGKAREAAATTEGFAHLAGHKYALLVTYKRSGESVATPVWFGVDDAGVLYCRTGKLAAKAKRIRNDPRVKVAPCSVRGAPRGSFADGTARIVDAAGEGHAEEAIQSN